MPLAFVLIACGYWRNPTMVGADKLLKSEDPARGMIRITRHPIMWGVMLWAGAHIARARRRCRSLVFFGGLLLLAGARHDPDGAEESEPGLAALRGVTSNVPFVAIAQGRNRIVWREIGWLRPAAALSALCIFRPWLFGQRAATFGQAQYSAQPFCTRWSNLATLTTTRSCVPSPITSFSSSPRP